MTQGKDVVIVGAGVGGMCAGALLAKHGYRVRVIDKLHTIGGRSRTQDVEGYQLPRGAVSFQLTGVLPKLCEEVGAEFEIRPVNEMWFWVKGSPTFTQLPAKGGISKMFEMFLKVQGENKAKAMAQVGLQLSLSRIGGAFKSDAAALDRDDGPTFREWLLKYTDNEDLLALFHAITSAVSAVNDFEYPARHWFAHFSQKGLDARVDKYGLLPGGFVSLSRALEKVIRANGGDVLLNTPVKRIDVSGGRATGVTIDDNGVERSIPADIVISNAGPSMTLTLAGETALGAEYSQTVRQRVRPTPIVLTFAESNEPLFPHHASFLAAGLQRIVTGVPLTVICPEWSHNGKHITSFYGTPKSCLMPMDKDEERRANIEDVHTLFPNFEANGGRILDVQLRDIGDPDVVARSWPGYQMPVETPLPNLFNVGDACGPPGFIATPAAGMSARLVVDRILAN